VRPDTQRCDGAALVTLDGCGEEVSRIACTDGDDCTIDGCSDTVGCAFTASTAPGCPGCVPACDGIACGVDPVCGVSCGACDDGEACLFGACVVDPCGEMPTVGCCDDGRAARCEAGALVTETCDPGDGCGWREADGRWGCGGADTPPVGDGGFCPWGPECSEAAHCDDADPCTLDSCADGACVHADDPLCTAEPGPEPGPEPTPELAPDDDPIDPAVEPGPEPVAEAVESAPEPPPEVWPDAGSEPSPDAVAESAVAESAVDSAGGEGAAGCGGCSGGGGSGAADWLWLLLGLGLAWRARRGRAHALR
jgi:MYXO-CTERM domain-containing protein